MDTLCVILSSGEEVQLGGFGTFIETQRKVLEDYCRSNDYEVYNFYCDDGYTGTNLVGVC